MLNRFPYTDFHEINLDWIIMKVKELDGVVGEFVKKVNDLQNDVDYVKGYVEKLDELIAEFSEALADVDNLKSEMVVAQGDIENLKTNITSLNTNMMNLSTAVANMGAKVDNAVETVEAMESTVNLLVNTVTELQTFANQLEEKIEENTTAIAQNASNISALQTVSEEHGMGIGNLNVKMANVEGELSNVGKRRNVWYMHCATSGSNNAKYFQLVTDMDQPEWDLKDGDVIVFTAAASNSADNPTATLVDVGPIPIYFGDYQYATGTPKKYMWNGGNTRCVALYVNNSLRILTPYAYGTSILTGTDNGREGIYAPQTIRTLVNNYIAQIETPVQQVWSMVCHTENTEQLKVCELYDTSKAFTLKEGDLFLIHMDAGNVAANPQILLPGIETGIPIMVEGTVVTNSFLSGIWNADRILEGTYLNGYFIVLSKYEMTPQTLSSASAFHGTYRPQDIRNYVVSRIQDTVTFDTVNVTSNYETDEDSVKYGLSEALETLISASATIPDRLRGAHVYITNGTTNHLNIGVLIYNKPTTIYDAIGMWKEHIYHLWKTDGTAQVIEIGEDGGEGQSPIEIYNPETPVMSPSIITWNSDIDIAEFIVNVAPINNSGRVYPISIKTPVVNYADGPNIFTQSAIIPNAGMPYMRTITIERVIGSWRIDCGSLQLLQGDEYGSIYIGNSSQTTTCGIHSIYAIPK